MRYYDFDVITRTITTLDGLIDSVEIGMIEDWSYTSMEIWNKEEGFLIDPVDGTTIHGIDGSLWAHPMMIIYFNDGSITNAECWKGTGETSGPSIEAMLLSDIIGMPIGK